MICAGRIDVGPEQVVGDGLPEHGDLLRALLTSCGVKKLPYFVGQLRISGRSTSVPWIWLDQFWLPAMTCAARVHAGRQVLHARDSCRSACASSAVSVVDMPPP